MNSSEINAAHFDCQFGAAGDMLLAALLDSGLVDIEQFKAELEKLDLPAGCFEIKLSESKRCGIKSTKLDVFSHEQVHHRHLSEILELIESSAISANAKGLAARIFRRLGRAEAKVHGVSVEEVHFHEVGAIDAIIDIVGFAIAFDLAELQLCSCTPLPTGSGVVKTEHGLLPVPAPAVVNLLAEVSAPTAAEPHIPFECLTPTGAAILCEIVSKWVKPISFTKILAGGFGAGTKDPQEWPNALRVTIGKTEMVSDAIAFERETVVVIEANIDDQSPQALSFAVDNILQDGALDALVMPATMKKGRSGFVLSVLCRPRDEVRMQEMILRHTSSIGCRSYKTTRVFAERRFDSALMPDGRKIQIKIASDKNGKIINVLPEFDDLALYAKENSISIKEASDTALLAFLKEGEHLCAGIKNGDGDD